MFFLNIKKKIVTYNDSLLSIPQTQQMRLENFFLTYPNGKGEIRLSQMIHVMKLFNLI